ncbi:MAG TPA: alkaline phosphatase PhoX [Acidimicrobiia bacterium]|nr:alkaline phosphatase PhoX [Acidimicrobiia bacterium]
MNRPQRPRRLLWALAASLALVATSVAPVGAKSDNSGFWTGTPAMLEGTQSNVTVKPLLTVGDTVGGYTFEAIPDGIALDPRGRNTFDIYVNHETSKVPFPFTATLALTDFDNAQMSQVTLKRGSGKVLGGELVIDSSNGYQRFCSNFFAGGAEGFAQPLVFTNEETPDRVNRAENSWPPSAGAPQAGLTVAYDPDSDTTTEIPGMGFFNHENTIVVPGFDSVVTLSGDDTFSRGNSQLYMYMADDRDALLDDQGTLYAFVADLPSNQYETMGLNPGPFTGHFIEVPKGIADGTDNPGFEQDALETWSDAPANSVFEFARIEDLAYDRNDPNVVYFADTEGGGAFLYGRIYKMVLDPDDPTATAQVSVLINGDNVGAVDPLAAIHSPDNIETTPWSLMIQEDPSPLAFKYTPGNPNGTTARIWQYVFATGELRVVARVNQSQDPAAVWGDWESSGIVDASTYFGRGAFLVTVQAHTLFVDTNSISNPLPPPASITQKREGGQLLLLRVPGA